MVKRDKGFNVVTHDWEFFELDVSKNGTQIRKRGFTDVVIDLAAIASHATSRPVPSGIWCARTTTAALRSL